MITFVTLVIIAVAIFAVAYPFVRQRDRSVEPETDEGSEDLRIRREKLYDAVRELDLERDSGTVSQEEHEKIRTTYEMQAAALLQEEERQVREARRPVAAKAAPSTAPLSHRIGLIIPAFLILVVGTALGLFLANSLTPTLSPLEEANAAFNRGDLRGALEGYRRVLDEDQRNVEALTQIGVLLARGQHHDEAILAFDRALTIQPDHPKALFEKGLVLFQGKVQPRKGVKVWEHLIKTAPPDNEYALTARRLLDQVRSSMGRPPTESPAKPSTR